MNLLIQTRVGKKNTKIYKAEHLPSGKMYAIKEVEAKTLDKLNEYKVSNSIHRIILTLEIICRRKLSNSLKYKLTRTCSSSMATTSMRRCITHSVSRWCANTWNHVRTSSISSVRESSKTYSGRKTNLKR